MKTDVDKMNSVIMEFIGDGEYIAYYTSHELLNIAYYKVLELVGERKYCEFTYNAPEGDDLFASFTSIYNFCRLELTKRQKFKADEVISIHVMSIFHELKQFGSVVDTDVTDVTDADAFSFVEKLLFDKGYSWRSNGTTRMSDTVREWDGGFYLNVRSDNKIGWTASPARNAKKIETLSALIKIPSIVSRNVPLQSELYDRAAKCARIFEEHSGILRIIELSDIVYFDDMEIKNRRSDVKTQYTEELSSIRAKKMQHIVTSDGYLHTYMFSTGDA